MFNNIMLIHPPSKMIASMDSAHASVIPRALSSLSRSLMAVFSRKFSKQKDVLDIFPQQPPIYMERRTDMSADMSVRPLCVCERESLSLG